MANVSSSLVAVRLVSPLLLLIPTRNTGRGVRMMTRGGIEFMSPLERTARVQHGLSIYQYPKENDPMKLLSLLYPP